jgi:predicted nucleic acid-binding protein
MHDRTIVVNTTPLIALSTAGCVAALAHLYEHVIVPREVADEILAGGPGSPGFRELSETPTLDVQASRIEIPVYLANALDHGEAAVIATALANDVPLVCIDETVGRRIARMSGLTLTGSIGVLIKAKRLGFPVVIRDAMTHMREHGIWLSETVFAAALSSANE